MGKLFDEGDRAADGDEFKTLHLMESKLLRTLDNLDHKVDQNLEDAHSLDGRALRYVASWVGWWGDRTPIVGDTLVRIQQEMVS